MILLRRLLGDALRSRRQRQGRTLREVSATARVSLGYLSEVERGQKEASSELLGAICTALDVPLSEVLRQVSDSMAAAETGRSYDAFLSLDSVSSMPPMPPMPAMPSMPPMPSLDPLPAARVPGARALADVAA